MLIDETKMTIDELRKLAWKSGLMGDYQTLDVIWDILDEFPKRVPGFRMSDDELADDAANRI